MSHSPPECVRLAAELRLLRERCGLTLSALSAASPYSRSSWQRYLAGRTLPPWPAVRTLCELAEEPEPRLEAMWELAESAWSRRTATLATPSVPSVPSAQMADPAGPVGSSQDADVRTEEPPTAEPGEPAEPGPVVPAVAPAGGAAGRARRRWTIGLAAGGVALLACTALTVSAADGGASPGAGSAHPSSSAFHVGCTGAACDGLDPGTELCGVEPQTLLHVQTPAGVGLEIRYNPLCQAAWARVWNARSGDRLSLSTQGRPTQSATVSHPSNVDPFVYTRLVAIAGGSAPLKACVTLGPGKAAECYSATPP
ncbi:DUF2690 domain-containing protein [Streptacidiphilus sp. N1-10]|uniref:DUF2690 domain-containing protein n=1 Tax=Streptacidiphilus jeojiensis TaxID=3229225 RepID=A0ABV6XKR3_9ACTN